jgi:hypothetical protein
MTTQHFAGTAERNEDCHNQDVNKIEIWRGFTGTWWARHPGVQQAWAGECARCVWDFSAVAVPRAM